jgi:chromosome segregation ATPase
MAEELLRVLTRFHREVVVPDIERIVESKITPLRNDMNAHFDAIYKRLDDLKSEYHAIAAAVARLEKRMDSLEKSDARYEIERIKAQIVDLQQRIAHLEADV